MRPMQNRLAKMQEEWATSGRGHRRRWRGPRSSPPAPCVSTRCRSIPACVDGEYMEMLQDLILAATNEALGKAQS